MLTILRTARAVLIACCLPAALLAEKPFAFADTPGQLPKTVVPRHYTLRLQPDLEQRTTTGTTTIELEVLSPVTELILNANDLEIVSAALTDDPAAPRPLTPRLDPAKQTLTLPVALAAGRHTVQARNRPKGKCVSTSKVGRACSPRRAGVTHASTSRRRSANFASASSSVAAVTTVARAKTRTSSRERPFWTAMSLILETSSAIFAGVFPPMKTHSAWRAANAVPFADDPA